MKVNYRRIQTHVIQRVKEAIAAGKTDIFINAPTGTGKGLIALALAQDFPSYILTSEKSLQSQYEEDAKTYDEHTSAKSICGLDTYNCNVNGEKFSLGVCRMMGKSNKEALRMPCASTCEYLQRWNAAKKAKRTIMNYSYWLIQMNLVLAKMEEDAPFDARHLVVCDEAHKLPDILESHFACSVDKKFINRVRSLIMLLRSNGKVDHDIYYEEIEQAIISCLAVNKESAKEKHFQRLKELQSAYTNLYTSLEKLKEDFANKYLSGSNDTETLKRKLKNMPREVRSTFAVSDSTKDRLCKLADYIEIRDETGLDCLVVDDVEKGEERKFHNLNDAHLFTKHFKKFSKVRIYLSATLQSELLATRFGLDEKEVLVLDVDSSWDRRRSPIVLCETANMTFKNQDASLKACISKIDALLIEHSGQRGIIHTTSNAIMNEIVSRCKNKKRLVPYSGTAEKMELLDNWNNMPHDAVLIGPSLTTGIDMRDDAARFNIVVKISFPNMGSALWAKRYEVANHIYIGEAASVLEQSCGRTTRSENDYSISYILDSRAKNFIQGNKDYFSSSFLERIL